MNEKGILNIAAKTERDGSAFYRKAAGDASNDLARKMFESLAAEEDKHLAFITAVMGKRKVAFAPADTLGNTRSIFASAPDLRAAELRATQTDRDAIDFALGIEEESYDFYSKWARQAEATEVRDLCATLAEEENKHWRLFSNLKEYLDRTGDWFMQEEHWIFEGG